MNKVKLVKLLDDASTDLKLRGGDYTSNEYIFGEKCRVLESNLGNFEQLSQSLEYITKYYFSNPLLVEWKYLICNIYVILEIGKIVDEPENSEMLSVKEIKIIKSSIANIVKIGIYTKLQPKLPFSIAEQYIETDDIFYQYNILKCTIIALSDFLKNDHLRVLVLTDSLRAILTGLYQIAYCPLRKNYDETFTEEIHCRLSKEKNVAIHFLQKLKGTIFPSIYIKETMFILQQTAPIWFKKSVSQMLTSIMISPKGVENIAMAILDGTGNDKTQTWQALDVIYRLILSCRTQPDFRENICQQVLLLVNRSDEETAVFERLFVTCTKNFYSVDMYLTKDIFVKHIVKDLLRFTLKDYVFQELDCTESIKRSVRLLHALFVEKTAESPCLPIAILKPILGVIFRIYSVTLNTVFKSCNSEAKAILVKYINDCSKEDNFVYDNFLFGISDSKHILPIRKNVLLEIEGSSVMIRLLKHTVTTSVADNSESLLKLLENKTKLLTRLFKYLLRCLVLKGIYFKKSNEGLLTIESDIMNEYFERKLVVFNVLSILTGDKNIQNGIIESPEEIIDFFHTMLESDIHKNVHKTTDYESESFHTVFTVIMILNSLVSNYSKKSLKMFTKLLLPLETIKAETGNDELKELIEKILFNIEVSDRQSTRINIEDSKTELDIILEDICDPLLPVRGHGLMALRKLVEKKDQAVIDKKQYILTIFQQSLKNEDSFIYLSAVDGLAGMANIFTDSVINCLCDEYSDYNRKGADGHEVRIKLGEVLVRVTRSLGDMAPKYKAVLLNTFLMGAKDEDHLVRASSLSNLGEICRVLGFKLGTVVTEVLVCVHAIIATDKSVEARRSAVTVIRQLLNGLESEMIAFLKEDILPIYRTLKQIYHSDKDDVMRLQAQLALEELNENMKNFVFPKPPLSLEKRIIMLD